MAGKRFLDIAALLNASRSVAQKHVALRGRQLDVYNRTSTLARAVRNQTDRITETAKAASILASRLNESAPAWTSEAADESSTGQSKDSETIPRKDAAEGSSPRSGVVEGFDQDHFYDRSDSNSVLDQKPSQNLEIRQEQAHRYPLPDGTIAADSNVDKPTVDYETFSTRPKDEPPKAPLEQDGFQPKSSSASTIPAPTSGLLSSSTARKIQRLSEDQIPSKTADALSDTAQGFLEEGHDKDSFYRMSGHTSPSLSSLPRVKIPKHPSSIQEGNSKLLNSDTFYRADKSQAQIPSVNAVPEQDQVPEGINTDLFYSPRIAKLLGGKTHGSSVKELELKGVKGTPLEESGLAEGKDQDTFNVRISSQRLPSTLEITPDQILAAEPTDAKNDTAKFAQDLAEGSEKQQINASTESASQHAPYDLRESKVPSSRLGRLWNYGGLAAGMFGGAITESIRRASGSGADGSLMLSASNMDRLVTRLSRMRGAALKLGQMMSFQDSKMLPAPIQEVLQRVQDRADYMPASQRNKVLMTNLGPDWRDLFSSFDERPLAAASIGQVHKAVLKSNGAPVAVKVQYPGVADSIDSDLSNLAILLTASRLLPKGLFLDKTIANARTELGWECDYIREAECGRRFEKLLSDEKDVFLVPRVYPEASGRQVLTMEFMDGVGVTRVQSFTQEQRDWIGTQILRLCLREITEFKYMQTDPNWTNFLYNAKTNKLELLDFGASREYSEDFITRYSKNLVAASKTDREAVRKFSIELGYLTGHESKAMLDAHISSVLTLAEPFLDSSPEVYDFKDQTITERVKALIPVMIRERLAPPPEETYSLHRKLSGAFLLCARLGSRVRCRELFEKSMAKAGLL